MNKYLAIFPVFVSCLLSAVAYASTGEYWDITSTMEMPGMPMAMPAQTFRVCQPTDHEIDPRKLNHNNKDCQITNLKISGHKITYSISCDHNGEVMAGNAEYIVHADTSEGTMHISGKSHGHDMTMTQTSSGKRVGGACDPEAEARDRVNKQEKMGRDIRDR